MPKRTRKSSSSSGNGGKGSGGSRTQSRSRTAGESKRVPKRRRNTDYDEAEESLSAIAAARAAAKAAAIAAVEKVKKHKSAGAGHKNIAETKGQRRSKSSRRRGARTAVRTDDSRGFLRRLPKPAALLSSDDDEDILSIARQDAGDGSSLPPSPAGQGGVNSGSASVHGAIVGGHEENIYVNDNDEDLGSDFAEDDEIDRSMLFEQTGIGLAQSRKDNSDVAAGKEHDLRRQKKTKNGAAKKKTNTTILEAAGQFDDYFRSHRPSSGKTSDETLESLNLPSGHRAREILSQQAPRHVKEKAKIMLHYVEQIPKWCFQMRCGFNILLHGFGSKRCLMDAVGYYVNSTQSDHGGAILAVNGFSPSCTAKEILGTILRRVIVDRRCPSNNIVEQAQFIARVFSGSTPPSFHVPNSHSSNAGLAGAGFSIEGGSGPSSSQIGGANSRNNNRKIPRRLYILFHNIDGPSLRGEHSQQALSFLAAADRIHFVATTDHVNSMFLWHQGLLQRFNWIWQQAYTFEHYDVETEFETMAAGGSNALAAQGTSNVLQSLTPNHRGILRLLAEYQLGEGKGSRGLDFFEFLSRCQSEMLAHRDVALRNILTELRDHELVSTRRSKTGQHTLYYIPLAEEVIRTVILAEESDSAVSP